MRVVSLRRPPLGFTARLCFHGGQLANRFGRPVPTQPSNLTRRTLTVLVAVTTLTHLGGDLRAAPPQERAPDPEQRPVFGADVALETISVGAVDASGVPIAGLTPADFFVKEDDQVREVAFVTAGADAPLDLALILDLSGSMGGGTWRPRTLEIGRAHV